MRSCGAPTWIWRPSSRGAQRRGMLQARTARQKRNAQRRHAAQEQRKDTHLVKAMLDQTLPKRGGAGRGGSPALAVQRRRSRLLARALRLGAIPRRRSIRRRKRRRRRRRRRRHELPICLSLRAGDSPSLRRRLLLRGVLLWRLWWRFVLRVRRLRLRHGKLRVQDRLEIPVVASQCRMSLAWRCAKPHLSVSS